MSVNIFYLLFFFFFHSDTLVLAPDDSAEQVRRSTFTSLRLASLIVNTRRKDIEHLQHSPFRTVISQSMALQ